MRRLATIGLGIFLLGGYGPTACTSPPPGGPAFEYAESPTADRMRVYIYRVDALRGIGDIALTLDDEPLGELADGEYETLLLEPGSHVLAAKLDWLGWIPRSWNRIEFSATAEQTVYLRVWADYENLRNPPLDPTPQALFDGRIGVALFLEEQRGPGEPRGEVPDTEIKGTHRRRPTVGGHRGGAAIGGGGRHRRGYGRGHGGGA